MSILKDIFKQMMNGFQYENAGENMPLKHKVVYLDQSPRVAVPVTTEVTAGVKPGNNVRHVALYMGSELPAEMMDYIMETCSSLKHALTVITFQTESTAKAMLKPYEKALKEAGIEMTLATLTGDPIARLKRYLKGHPEIAFLACKETGYLAHSYMNGPKDKSLLPVPVVVVVNKSEEGKLLQETTTAGTQDKSINA